MHDLTPYRNYEDLVGRFRWQIPPRYNMAAATVDHWASVGPGRPALICEDREGRRVTWTFRSLQEQANRLAHGLVALGVTRGDRVALVLPQCAEVGITHLALHKIGAVSVPLSFLYGPATLEYILNDCRAVAIVIAADFAERLRGILSRLPHLGHVIMVAGPGPGLAWADPGGGWCGRLHHRRHRRRGSRAPHVHLGDDGTAEGSPARSPCPRRLPGDHHPRLQPALRRAHGLLDALGLGVGGRTARRGAPRVGVRVSRPRHHRALRPRTGLPHDRRRWRHAHLPRPHRPQDDGPGAAPEGALRDEAGSDRERRESVAAEVLRWGEEELGVVVNEFYGLTEVNHLIGSCAALWPVRAGFMGRPYPGREVDLVDAAGTSVGDGAEGQIVVKRGDPTGFLGYWEKPEKTRDMLMRRGDAEWLQTGDLAARDEHGYFRFLGRNDDLIKSGGYRIGPAEVEESLLALDEVAEAAVIGAPDAIRGAVVKAFVRLAEGFTPSDAIRQRIRDHVKRQVAAYKSPREIEFVDAFPLTTTGKIDRKLLRRQEAERQEAERQEAERQEAERQERARVGSREGRC